MFVCTTSRAGLTQDHYFANRTAFRQLFRRYLNTRLITVHHEREFLFHLKIKQKIVTEIGSTHVVFHVSQELKSRWVAGNSFSVLGLISGYDGRLC